MPKSKKKTCLHDKNVVYSRGVCWGCFQQHQIAVQSGQITDEKAVERGLILPKKKPGPKRSRVGYSLSGKKK